MKHDFTPQLSLRASIVKHIQLLSPTSRSNDSVGAVLQARILFEARTAACCSSLL